MARELPGASGMIAARAGWLGRLGCLVLVVAVGCDVEDEARDHEIVLESSVGGPTGNGTTSVYRTKLAIDQGYATIEILDDDLVHVEYGTGAGPAIELPVTRSTMVGEQVYPGPSRVAVTGRRIETTQLRLDIDVYGCVAVTQLSDSRHLTTVCPVKLAQAWKGISLDPSGMTNVYGLGQYFLDRGSADGDWIRHGRFRTDGEFGNHFRDFWGGADPQLQFPVMYAAGPGKDTFGLFLDNVYKQDWDFASDSWWQVRMYGDNVRYYLMSGPDLRDVRADYMELTGRPPVPPRKVFGLWLSEFGFDDWAETDDKLATLRAADFPVDGFMLDLQWFGGVYDSSPNTPMGGLAWDRAAFADPETKVRHYAQDGIGVMPIEESYVGQRQTSYGELAQRQGLAHVCNTDYLTEFTTWMGKVGMIDWSARGAAAWWHDHLRQPNLVALGVTGHWTDLGEPERFYAGSCYGGQDYEAGKYHHADIHNLYNLLWHRSVYDGYVRHHAETPQRPFLLARAGTAGIQRYGAAMWSGDIASRLDVLATHENAAMHMAFAGVDYYGSDVGGFWRRALPGDTNVTVGSAKSERELYTQWFANSAWFDVPLRPHTYNCGFAGFPTTGCPYEVSPARIGDTASNLANLRQRYELIPYYYSLAYRAFVAGEPLIAPVVMNFPEDPQVRQMGHERMLGRDLLIGVVASHGEAARQMYLPAGTWFDYHTGRAIRSTGQWTEALPVRAGGVFQLPVFARAGAILPMMWVDAQTKDAFGHRKDGTTRDELIAKVYASTTATSFELYEDDGATVAAYVKDRPTYATRTTTLRQVADAGHVTVTIEAAVGSYPSAPAQRDHELRVVTEGRRPAGVTVEGAQLPARASVAALRAAGGAGYAVDTDGTIVVRTGVRGVGARTQAVITLQ